MLVELRNSHKHNNMNLIGDKHDHRYLTPKQLMSNVQPPGVRRRTTVPRNTYHHPAINLRLLPSHNATERKVEKVAITAPMAAIIVLSPLAYLSLERREIRENPLLHTGTHSQQREIRTLFVVG